MPISTFVLLFLVVFVASNAETCSQIVARTLGIASSSSKTHTAQWVPQCNGKILCVTMRNEGAGGIDLILDAFSTTNDTVTFAKEYIADGETFEHQYNLVADVLQSTATNKNYFHKATYHLVMTVWDGDKCIF